LYNLYKILPFNLYIN